MKNSEIDWKKVKLEDILSELYRYPSYYNIQYVDKGVPEIRGEFLLGNGEIEIDITKFRFISEETSKEFPKTKLEDGDFVMSVRGTMGKIGLVRKNYVGAIITANLIRISLDRNKCFSEYFKYYFLSKLFQNELQRLSPNTTIKTIQVPLLKSIKLSLPCITEQKAIAEILLTVDNAIQKADEAIKKTERIKQAMLQKLLTKGIGHKEFKETKIGRIPKEWEIKKISEVINKSEKVDPTKSHIEFQYVDISSIDNLTYKIIATNKINKDNAPSRARKLIKKDNIIFATTRPYLRNIALIPQSLDNQICSTGFCVMEANVKIITPYWLFYNVITNRFNKRIEGKMKGATYPAVNDSDLYEEKIPIPSINEQNKMTTILKDFDHKLNLEMQRELKLQKIKQGLMDDLLTGKKRIKI